MNEYSIYDSRDSAYLATVEAESEWAAIVEYRCRVNAATMPLDAYLERIDIHGPRED